jgi:hypothetical protein
MVIELLAIFLDSGIIPTAHAVYPVSRALSHGSCVMANVVFDQSGLPPYMPAWSEHFTGALLSMDSWAFNLRKTEHRCLSG